MGVLSRDLITALLELEQAAAAVGRLLPADDPELLQEIAAGFGPLRPKGYSISRWHQFWLHWLQSSAALHPCANPAGAAETRANGPIGPASWPQPFCDDVVQSAVFDAQNPDSFVPETQIRP